jgi:hypothetical protein
MKTGQTTIRRVTHQMGAWKWGHPRGQRIALIEYQARSDTQGRLRWYRLGEICSGLTATNEPAYRDLYPNAFINEIGSLHRKLCK